MIQQINLYRDTLLPHRTKLPARQIFTGLVATMLLLLIYAGWSQLQLNKSKQVLADTKAEAEIRQTELKTLSELIEKRKPNEALISEGQLLEADLIAKRQLINSLQSDNDSASGFSPFLEALARQRIEPLWLTKILLTDAGAQVGLQGKTLDPSHVTDYLARLSNEEIFKRREFGFFQLQRHDNAAGVLTFALASSCNQAESSLASICDSGKDKTR